MNMCVCRRILCVSFLTWLVTCSASEEIKAKSGEDIILQCRGPREGAIELLEWTKPELKSEDYVFYFREERSYEKYQHPLFRGRVELRDPQMKDGDASVILKNVNISDTGTYECYVGTKGNRPELISRVQLQVKDSGGGVRRTEDGGDKDGHVGLVAGLDDRTYGNYQHSSFHGRVELTDPQMKDGDVSVILKNVNINDTGTYECHVGTKGNSPELISSVQLQVKDSDPHVKTVQTGEDVPLPCQGPRGADIVFLKWIRPDLKSEGSVFFFRDDRTYENYQHPSFHGRVELRDSQMKDGDASVIVKNVTIKDTGTYQCYVGKKGSKPQLISSVHLQVKDLGDLKNSVSGGGAGNTEDGGDKDEQLVRPVILKVAVVLSVVAVVAVVGFVIYRKRGKRLNSTIVLVIQKMLKNHDSI